MKDKNHNKKKNPVLDVISVFLWSFIIVWVLRSYFQVGGSVANVVTLVCIMIALGCFIAYFAIYFLPVRRLVARINKAAFQYQLTYDGGAYLAELESCCKMFGVKKAAFCDMPAKDYLEILKIRTLREMGRTEESRTLLEAIRQETTNDLTQQSRKAEEEQLQSTGTDDGKERKSDS